ncbi:hypothetical protein GA0115255_126132 [Streptomyces sp. Ncost-T6T-2b]|nr:hypothetical protein GA0115255_126132 [Streptomyces sp. Ncost-T6T-2b]
MIDSRSVSAPAFEAAPSSYASGRFEPGRQQGLGVDDDGPGGAGHHVLEVDVGGPQQEEDARERADPGEVVLLLARVLLGGDELHEPAVPGGDHGDGRQVGAEPAVHPGHEGAVAGLRADGVRLVEHPGAVDEQDLRDGAPAVVGVALAEDEAVDAEVFRTAARHESAQSRCEDVEFLDDLDDVPCRRLDLAAHRREEVRIAPGQLGMALGTVGPPPEGGVPLLGGLAVQQARRAPPVELLDQGPDHQPGDETRLVHDEVVDDPPRRGDRGRLRGGVAYEAGSGRDEVPEVVMEEPVGIEGRVVGGGRLGQVRVLFAALALALVRGRRRPQPFLDVRDQLGVGELRQIGPQRFGGAGGDVVTVHEHRIQDGAGRGGGDAGRSVPASYGHLQLFWHSAVAVQKFPLFPRT